MSSQKSALHKNILIVKSLHLLIFQVRTEMLTIPYFCFLLVVGTAAAHSVA